MSAVTVNEERLSESEATDADRKRAERIKERMKDLDRRDVEWYAQVAARNRATEQKRADR